MAVVVTKYIGLPMPLTSSQSCQQRFGGDRHVQIRPYSANQIRHFRFSGGKILAAIQAEKCRDISITPVIEESYLPAQHSGGVTQGG